MFEEQLVQHFTVPELRALARWFDRPESASVMRKPPALTAAVAPMLEAEIVAWARSVRLNTSAGAAGGGDPAAHRSP